MVLGNGLSALARLANDRKQRAILGYELAQRSPLETLLTALEKMLSRRVQVQN